MAYTDREVLNEVRQRVVRLETRLVVLAKGMGVDLSDQDYVEVNADDFTVDLLALDVSMSSVLNKCRRLNLHGKTVRVFYKNEPLAELYV